MILSSLQLKQYFFTRAIVNARTEEDDHRFQSEPQGTPSFDFIGVNIVSAVEVGEVAEQEFNPHDFVIKLSITIENKNGKVAPYDISIEAIGYFAVSDDVDIEKRRNLVVFNGCSVLYSAIREMVLTITSRCTRGSLILPTVNFVEHLRHNMENPSGASSHAIPPAAAD